jgi:succinate dehydrogenase / fumarate reductase, membrane anchor subunit
MSMRSPLGRVVGHGAAGGAVHHWWLQRLTSVALLPLGIWFIVSLAYLPLNDHAAVVSWLQQGWNALLLLSFALVAIWHSQLGLQVIIEDYVHGHGLKTLALVAAVFLHVGAAAACLFTVLKIVL